MFANVVSVLWEVVSGFLGKFRYLLLMVKGAAAFCSAPYAEGRFFLHILLFLTVAGAVMNTYMFNPTKDKYYAVILLGMNAREYALGNYAYAQLLKNISSDRDVTSNRKGFSYLNELFVKRHRRILWRASLQVTAVALVLLLAVLTSFRFRPQLEEAVNGILMDSLPYLVFVMYLINRGTGFTTALFVNCDHSLLTYPFYKKLGYILKLFWIRLGEMIKVNLLPAAVIGSGLSLLLYMSGGMAQPLDYLVLAGSAVCLGIFFSVYYLTLYYLLQPYNAGTELKSAAYKVSVWATYIVCYLVIQVKMPTLLFGILTIGFCVLYCLAASFLVYRYAPKTFRIRIRLDRFRNLFRISKIIFRNKGARIDRIFLRGYTDSKKWTA